MSYGEQHYGEHALQNHQNVVLTKRQDISDLLELSKGKKPKPPPGLVTSNKTIQQNTHDIMVLEREHYNTIPIQQHSGYTQTYPLPEQASALLHHTQSKQEQVADYINLHAHTDLKSKPKDPNLWDQYLQDQREHSHLTVQTYAELGIKDRANYGMIVKGVHNKHDEDLWEQTKKRHQQQGEQNEINIKTATIAEHNKRMEGVIVLGSMVGGGSLLAFILYMLLR